MAKVEIYSSATCPYCINAKMLLQKKGQDYQEIRIDINDSSLETMIERSGGKRSVPQIFINDVHVGGFDDMSALDVAGELDPLLSQET